MFNDINKIIIIAIIILAGIILVVGIYFIVNQLKNRQKKVKEKDFEQKKLVEEESLLNVMDDKKNIEFNNKKDETQFVNSAETVSIAKSEAIESEEKQNAQVNPFGVDLTNQKQVEEVAKIKLPEQKNNKYFTE